VIAAVPIRRIYLNWFDIDDHGNQLRIPGTTERCLILYSLFFDSVVLQSSSALKHLELRTFFIGHKDFFIKQNACLPLISFSLEEPEKGFNAYLDGRLETLGKLKKPKQNKEYSQYINFDAMNIAKSLDEILTSADIYQTVSSVDAQFRQLLGNLTVNLPIPDDKTRKIERIIRDVATKEQVCQTFEMLRRSENALVIPNSSAIIDNLGKQLRQVYFTANALGNQSLLPQSQTDTDFNRLSKYSNDIKLSTIFQGAYQLRISANMINEIKANKAFRFLIDEYFTHATDFTTIEELERNVPRYKANLKEFKRFLGNILSTKII
jgi:hypothetical protein